MAKAPVSVVVPAYRAERTICRTVDSVLADPAAPAVVVVIDGSMDRTEEMLESYPRDRVRVIARQENWGASRTRNQGLEQVDSEYVMFLDADDWVEDSLIQGLVDAMNGSGADVAFGPMQILYENRGRRGPRFQPDFASSLDVFRKWHLGGIYVSPCSVLWRTEFLRRIGGWDAEVTRNDDGELVMRAILLGAEPVTSSQGCGVYVKHSAESLNSRTDNMASMLIVNEKLLALQSPTIGRDDQREICAGHYLNIAWHCYLSGQAALGDEALKRGWKMRPASWGPRRYRLPLKLLGLKRTARLVARMKRALSHAGG